MKTISVQPAFDYFFGSAQPYWINFGMNTISQELNFFFTVWGRVGEAVLDLVRDESGQVGTSGLAEGVRGHQLESFGRGSSVRDHNVLKRKL